ncbi:S8 family peptidase [Thalassiella azotivora]
MALVAPAATALAAPAGEAELAPLMATDSPNAVKGSYIVVLKDQHLSLGARQASETVTAAADRAEEAGVEVTHKYTTAIRGYAAEMTDAELAEVRKDPAVDYVEADQVMKVAGSQSNATWGLDRVDQRNLPLNRTYTWTPTGSGVDAYIIDTGVLTSHQEFSGRTASGYSAVNDGRGTTDCNGHGTHVAGTVGGTTYGVAKGVTIIPVRVLGCDGSGSNSGVIAGMDWVANNASGPSVANMSLGGGASTATDAAVNRMVSAGVTVVVAAGNENQNACNVSPARAPAALTVGSTTNSDARSSFSNYGSCVDVFAPGSNITSAWYTSNSATNTISGTSMASPHGAGVAALYLQGAPNASPATVNNAIVSTSTPNVLSGVGSGSPNRLLYSLLSGGGGGEPTPTPTPTPTDPPSGDCSGTVTGSLSGARDSDVYTYTVSGSGQHSGCLTGPSGTDFDLYLQKQSWYGWTTVARGISGSSTENVTYNGTAGNYRWVVQSYSGSGSYTLKYGMP